jgi:hypothetical protein
VLYHGGEERNGAADIDAIVFERNLARFSDGLGGVSPVLSDGSDKCAHLQSSKVNDVVDIWVLLEDFVERSLICDIALVKSRSLAANELDAVDDFWRGVVKVVDDDDFVVCFEECKGRERANVAGATKPLSVLIRRDAVLEVNGGVEG